MPMKALARPLVGWSLAAVGGLAAGMLLPFLQARSAAPRDVQPQFLSPAVPVAQPGASRVWQPFPWTEIGAVGASAGVKSPAFMSLGAGGRLLLLDADDYSIKTLESPGRVVTSRAIPRETLVTSATPLTGMAAAADGSLWFCNPGGRLVGLRPDSDDPIVLPKAYKVAAIGDRLLVMEGLGERHLFSTYDRAGTRLAQFGDILAAQETDGIAIDGPFAVDDRAARLVFAPYYAGFVASFDVQGTLRFVRSTIDAVPLPPVRHVEGGVLASKPGKYAVRLSDVAISGDDIYTLASVPDGQQRRRSVVDLYAAADGQYRHSFTLPASCSDVEITDGLAFANCDSRIVVWSTRPASRLSRP